MEAKRPRVSLSALIEREARNLELSIGHPDRDVRAGIAEDGIIKLPYSARAAHLHVIGRTRSGKSRFIADLIRQDIQNGRGVCVIDPHGELYDLTLNWLAQNKRLSERRKNIHPVCFTDLGTTFRYNPLRIAHQDEAYSVASNVTNAITRIYGGKDATETPLTWFVLDVACTILALRELPLAAARHFLMNSAFDRTLRDQISADVPNPYYRELGLEMSRMPAREFRETVASTGRRLHQFFRNPAIERIFSVTENTADLSRVMEERHVLLLNTSNQGGAVDREALRTLGMLFVNNLFQAAEKRDPRTKPTPFFLYVDEAQNYLSNDIEDILSQAAKRGLYLTLSHQFLGQLVEAGELIYNGVMSGALIKAVFGITMAEAEVFADELFADRIDFERVKEKLKAPHVVDHEITHLRGTSKGTSVGSMFAMTTGQSEGESMGSAHSVSDGHSESETESHSSTESSGYSTSSGEWQGTSESQYVPTDPSLDVLGLTEGLSHGSSTMASESNSRAFSDAYSRALSTSHVEANTTSASRSTANSHSMSFGGNVSFSTGESTNEALKPVIKWFSTQTYTLEEQRYALKRLIANQNPRHGFLAVGRKGTIGFTSRDVPDMLNIPQSEKVLLDTLRNASPWLCSSTEIPPLHEHPTLKAILTKKATKPELPEEPTDWFEPEE